jgi:hypothetical protein
MLRNSLLSLLCVGAFSTQLKAEGGMINEVIGDKAPFFLGHIADDTVYALSSVNQAGRAWSEQAGEDLYAAGCWVLSKIKSGGVPLFRTSYHGAKIALGCFLCMESVPNDLLGISGYRGEAVPGWKKVAKHVPTRVAGLGLIWHGLRGILGQWGFEDFASLYKFMEGHDVPAQAETEKKPKSSSKQR